MPLSVSNASSTKFATLSSRRYQYGRMCSPSPTLSSSKSFATPPRRFRRATPSLPSSASWAGSAPLWPELSTGVTDLRMATGEAPTSGEHQKWYEHDDPVLRLARALIATKPANMKRVFEIDARVRDRMKAAEALAIASPPPAASSLLEHVFA